MKLAILEASAIGASPKLSSATKMPCPSWSLPAIVTCPGSLDADGNLVAACSGCYAAQGRYLFGNVDAVRQHNMADWQHADWTDKMVRLIDGEPFFRWFDSGDVYSPELAGKILAVCLKTPATRHWIPTRARKDARILPILRMLASLPNVVVRHSSDSVTGQRLAGFEHTSTIVADTTSHNVGRQPDGTIAGRCSAWQREGKCGDCRLCWDKRVAVIEYPQHGKKVAQKTIDRLVAAAAY